jgi:hypothetical protein
MSFILWPAAVLVFIVWSLASLLLFGASEWLAGLIGSMSAGILSADLGPWAQALTNGLGNIIQVGVVALWAIVGLAILSIPIILRRRRMQPRYASEPSYHDRGLRNGGWRDQEAWRERARYGSSELAHLRHIGRDMADAYRTKKWKKKKNKKWDDD